MTAEEALDQLEIVLDKLIHKIEKKQPNPESMKKNSHIHIMISTSEKIKLMRKAKEECMDFSEWCRKKLRGSEQLNRIEGKIDRLLLSFS